MKINYDVYQIIENRKLAIERNKTTRQAMIEIGYSLRTYGRSGAEIREYLRERGYPINSKNVYPINPKFHHRLNHEQETTLRSNGRQDINGFYWQIFG